MSTVPSGVDHGNKYKRVICTSGCSASSKPTKASLFVVYYAHRMTYYGCMLHDNSKTMPHHAAGKDIKTGRSTGVEQPLNQTWARSWLEMCPRKSFHVPNSCYSRAKADLISFIIVRGKGTRPKHPSSSYGDE